MKTRCKPSDVALVLFDLPGCQDNIGKLVRIEGALQWHSAVNLHCWVIKPLMDELWKVVEHDGSVSYERYDLYDVFIHPDSWLLPIRRIHKEPVQASAIFKQSICTEGF